VREGRTSNADRFVSGQLIAEEEYDILTEWRTAGGGGRGRAGIASKHRRRQTTHEVHINTKLPNGFAKILSASKKNAISLIWSKVKTWNAKE